MKRRMYGSMDERSLKLALSEKRQERHTMIEQIKELQGMPFKSAACRDKIEVMSLDINTLHYEIDQMQAEVDARHGVTPYKQHKGWQGR